MPLILQLYNPKSMVDAGCAEGTWLNIAINSGVVNVMGYDSNWVRDSKAADLMAIHPDLFYELDFEKPYADLQKADVALCLEVAEHLSETAGANLIKKLCRSAPIVVFSAAIPGQGGVGHINEQWQSYWAQLFAVCNYWPHDELRQLIWTDVRVQPYYQQNILTFNQDPVPRTRVLDVVHPRFYDYKRGR